MGTGSSIPICFLLFSTHLISYSLTQDPSKRHLRDIPLLFLTTFPQSVHFLLVTNNTPPVLSSIVAHSDESKAPARLCLLVT